MMQMKTSAWIMAAGLAIGMTTGTLAVSAPRAALAAAPMADDKVDLTPRYTKGQTIIFKQHTVRKDTMALGNMPVPEKPAEKPAEGGKDAPKGEPSKADAPKSEPAKADSPKTEPAKSEPAKDSKPAAAQPPSGPMTSTQTTDQTATYELRVLDADAKGATFELELKSVVATAELPAGKFTWDSAPTADDKDAANPILVAFRPIVGAVMKIAVGPDGNITKVEPDAQRYPATPPGGPLAPMVQQLIGVDGVRLRFGPALWIKDGREPTAVGKTWTNSDEMIFRAVGKFTYESTNTLKSVKDDAAQIDISGVVKLGGTDDGKPAQGTLKEQSARGSCVWDVKAGLVKSHVWEQKTVLALKVGGAFDVVRTSEFTVTTTRQ
jgi:outer membrane biosynthesis protein TonB